MGNKKSTPEVNTNGDQVVTVINKQDQHTTLLEEHQVKLWLVLVLQLLQISLTIFKWYQKRIRRRAFLQGRKSQDALNTA